MRIEVENREPSALESAKEGEWEGRGVILLTGVIAIGVVVLTVIKVAQLIYGMAKEILFPSDLALLETQARSKYSKGLIETIKTPALLKRLALSQGEEQRFLVSLDRNYELGEEVFLGKTIRLSDGGEAFRSWSSLEGTRFTYFTAKHHLLNGALIKEVEFSEVSGDTLFHLECHPLSLRHIARYSYESFVRMMNKIEGIPCKTPLELNRKGQV